MTAEGDAQRSILRDSGFLRLWTATTASGLATWALPLVLGLAVLEGSLTPVDLGLVLAVRTVGFLLAVPIAGVYADRHSRRGVILVSAGTAALATPLIALGLGSSVLVMCLGSLLAGAGQGACRPVFSALVADVIDADRRQAANAAITLAVRVVMLAAPALTALASVLIGTRGVLLGITVLWLVAALLPPAGRQGAADRAADQVGDPAATRFWAELAGGVREARRHSWFLAGLAALAAVIMTGYSATAVVLPIISRDRGGEALLAAALTGYTVGALLGAVLMARWRPVNEGWVALVGLGLYSVVPAAMLLPVPSAVIVASYAVAGLGIELFNVPWFTATQREVPPRLLARVSSVDFLVSYGLAPLGLALIAPAIDLAGIEAVLIACAVVCLAAPAAAAPVRTSRHFGSGPSGGPAVSGRGP